METTDSKKNSKRIIHVDEVDEENKPDNDDQDLQNNEEERELSLDEIDGAIAEEDPNFLSGLTEIAKDKSLTMAELTLTNDEQAMIDERERLKRLGKIGLFLVTVFPFLPRVILRQRKISIVINNWLLAQKIILKNFIYFVRTQGLALMLKEMKKIWEDSKDLLRDFNYYLSGLSSWRKWFLFGTVVLTVLTAIFVYRSWTHGVIPEGEDLFIQSFEKVADKIYTYDAATESEPFYENLRSESNVFLIPKVVVNIKKSKSSGSNPMAAFEFIIEGWAPEAVLEFKNREIEFRDLIQRTIEEYTFDQLESGEGKKAMCQQIQKVVNSKLTMAQIKRVLIKTAIVKP